MHCEFISCAIHGHGFVGTNAAELRPQDEVTAYLLVSKRLFGERGMAKAEARVRERDSGWFAPERSASAQARMNLVGGGPA
jgi:hypothetical protein